MKYSLPTFSYTKESFLRHPLSFVFFLYFLTASGDLFNLSFLFFKVKLINLIALCLLLVAWAAYKKLYVDREYLLVAVFCLGSMLLSTFFGYNRSICLSFVFFFAFNYVFYFLLSFNTFFWLREEWVFRLYFLSFLCVGCYAAAQIISSLFGVFLPFTTQRIAYIARGQGFSYEPSYYALYMTSFTMFQNAQYFLEGPEKRNWRRTLLANLLLLASTSTGCFFSYLCFVAVCFLFQGLGFVKRWIDGKLLLKVTGYCIATFTSLFILNYDLIRAGFLKFFYLGFQHGSFAERWDVLWNYFRVFLEHPWVGTGLGGTSTYLLNEMGMDIADFLNVDLLNDPRLVPLNVTTELLAGLGIVGGSVFLYFLYRVARTFQKALRIPTLSETERVRLLAFAISFCVLLFTLQFNQSIMRAYIWVHVGLGVGYAKFLCAKIRG